LRVFGGSSSEEPIVSVDNDAVRAEAVQLAEDGSGDVVVRLYEAEGGRARTAVHVGFVCGDAGVVDLLERPLRGLELDAGSVRLALRSFEIVTLRFTRTG
jgi:alpha-mannosidase